MGIREEMEKFEKANIGTIDLIVNNESGQVEITVNNLDGATMIYACNEVLCSLAKKMETDVEHILLSMLATNQEMRGK